MFATNADIVFVPIACRIIVANIVAVALNAANVLLDI